VGAWLRDVTRPTDCATWAYVVGQVMESAPDGGDGSGPVYLVCCEGEDENFWVRECDAVEVQR